MRIEKLRRDHVLDGFDCGAEPLNRHLKRHALANQQAHAARTYVAVSDLAVPGYYSLAAGEVSHAGAPERVTRGLARDAVPVLILARLAVHLDWQGKKIGAGLLKDATLRTLQAAEIAGIRALIVHAKDDSARAFYEHFGFETGFSDPLHLYILTKELQRIAGAA